MNLHNNIYLNSSKCKYQACLLIEYKCLRSLNNSKPIATRSAPPPSRRKNRSRKPRLARLRESVTGVLSHVEMRAPPPLPQAPQEMHETREDPAMAGASGTGASGAGALPAGAGGAAADTARRPRAESIDPDNPATWGRVSRNAACPCGSGKKYKHCHGQLN
jgi:hypothetical protein